MPAAIVVRAPGHYSHVGLRFGAIVEPDRALSAHLPARSEGSRERSRSLLNRRVVRGALRLGGPRLAPDQLGGSAGGAEARVDATASGEDRGRRRQTCGRPPWQSSAGDARMPSTPASGCPRRRARRAAPPYPARRRGLSLRLAPREPLLEGDGPRPSHPSQLGHLDDRPVENPAGEADTDRPLRVEAAKRPAHECSPAVVTEPRPVLGHAGAVGAKMRVRELSKPRPADEADNAVFLHCQPRIREHHLKARRLVDDLPHRLSRHGFLRRSLAVDHLRATTTQGAGQARPSERKRMPADGVRRASRRTGRIFSAQSGNRSVWRRPVAMSAAVAGWNARLRVSVCNARIESAQGSVSAAPSGRPVWMRYSFMRRHRVVRLMPRSSAARATLP